MWVNFPTCKQIWPESSLLIGIYIMYTCVRHEIYTCILKGRIWQGTHTINHWLAPEGKKLDDVQFDLWHGFTASRDSFSGKSRSGELNDGPIGTHFCKMSFCLLWFMHTNVFFISVSQAIMKHLPVPCAWFLLLIIRLVGYISKSVTRFQTCNNQEKSPSTAWVQTICFKSSAPYYWIRSPEWVRTMRLNARWNQVFKAKQISISFPWWEVISHFAGNEWNELQMSTVMQMTATMMKMLKRKRVADFQG